MSVGRSAALSDAGRRRRGNEDSFVHEPPLFAVCDGMGGALAGELASRLAATALEEAVHRGGPIDLVEAILEGNRRIHERSRIDAAASGMGTTVTAVLARKDGRLQIGHVGDSRAYRLRGGAIEQLTPDHSLVAELVRIGQISPEEAEGHPQRAVITRALGTDLNVEVDTFEIASEPGDLYLLCSDGLTTMVGNEQLRAILLHSRDDLQAATRALIAAANAGGGEDNITCVLFETVAADTASTAAEQTAIIPAAAAARAPDEDTLSGLDSTGEQAMILPAQQAGTGWDAPADAPTLDAPATRAARPRAAARPAQPARTTRKRRRKLPYVIALLLLIVAAAIAAIASMSREHFVGADARGRLVVYQGVPWDLTKTVHLYRAVYVSPVLAAQLSQPERLRLFDHGLHSKSTALADVQVYEREILR